MFTSPHRRYNPLLNSWVLVSPQRLKRPWQGKIEDMNIEVHKTDPNNPLAPNAIRANGDKNPNYESTFIFENDFPALLNEIVEKPPIQDSDNFNFFQVEIALGNCYVMCFHPFSNVTLGTMKLDEIINVINNWMLIISDQRKNYEWIQIFENRGVIMGCSNPHPHCQIWSTKYLPTIPFTKNRNQLEYFDKYKRPMLYDYAIEEIKNTERIVLLNDSWVCLVPFWAEWPFETMLIPRRINVHRLNDLNEIEVKNLAIIMQVLLKKYNNLFNVDFPYSMGWHGAPTGSYLNIDSSHWTLHAIYYPPLLRSATIKKFFVGFELLAETQRDFPPEQAAEILRNISVD